MCDSGREAHRQSLTRSRDAPVRLAPHQVAARVPKGGRGRAVAFMDLTGQLLNPPEPLVRLLMIIPRTSGGSKTRRNKPKRTMGTGRSSRSHGASQS